MEDQGMEVFFAALLGIVATDAPTVSNPGFEELSQRTGLPLGWSFTSLPNQANLVRYEARAPHAGQKSRALAITVAADHPEQAQRRTTRRARRNATSSSS